MYYLLHDSPGPNSQRSKPRDIVHGPFATANEAQGYWTKLTMWFPEALQGAHYEITGQVAKDGETMEHTPRRQHAV